MPERVVISDASTVIGLLNIGNLALLQALYSRVEITSVVSQEIGESLPTWFVINDDYSKDTYQSMVPILDKGEASAIALALNYANSLLIIDERKGRRQAMQLGLQVTGLVGIIVRAKKEGVIPSGKHILDKLMQTGFRLSSRIFQNALQAMDEV